MGRTKSKIELPDGVTDRGEKPILEAALQNPDLGARRLVPLLKRRKTAVSASKIYRILKRHGLQTIEKRRAFLKKQETEHDTAPEKSSTEITPEIEEIIVDTSLQNPELGAKRLRQLFQQEGLEISVSAVYGILKRNNLQNREKRLAAAANRYGHAASADKTGDEESFQPGEGQPIESFPETARIEWGYLEEEWVEEDEIILFPPEDATPAEPESLQISPTASGEAKARPLTGPLEKVFESAAVDDAAKPKPGEAAPAAPAEVSEPAMSAGLFGKAQRQEKSSGGIRWLFRFVNLMLLVLIGYLGFSMIQNFRQAPDDIEAAGMISPRPVAMVSRKKPDPSAPLQAYSAIWERNLFNVKEKQEPEPVKEIAIEKLAPAKKNIGLSLVGTVYSSESSLNRAIVYIHKSRKEETFREGDEAGQVRIKKILRNKVIITTADGDQLLTIDQDDSAKRRAASTGGRQALLRPRASSSPRSSLIDATASAASGSSTPRIRTMSIKLKQEQIDQSLNDIDGLLDELKISPYLSDDVPAGFIVSKIPRRSILTRMGLRNGYAVTHLNDQAISGPEEAAEFFQTLASGSDVSFQIQKSRGIRRRVRQINLTIE